MLIIFSFPLFFIKANATPSGAWDEASPKDMGVASEKVEKLFNNLRNIQIRLCKLLRQREVAINGAAHLSKDTKDAIEGPKAFAEKREPKYEGR